jgi:hypothetical protein
MPNVQPRNGQPCSEAHADRHALEMYFPNGGIVVEWAPWAREPREQSPAEAVLLMGLDAEGQAADFDRAMQSLATGLRGCMELVNAKGRE